MLAAAAAVAMTALHLDQAAQAAVVLAELVIFLLMVLLDKQE
jgi:hypothetical protein